MRLHIEVSEEDIRGSVRRNYEKCMVARAIHRCSEGTLQAQVTGVYACVYTSENASNWGAKHVVVPLDVRARARLGDFDRGKRIEPFAFDLDLEALPT